MSGLIALEPRTILEQPARDCGAFSFTAHTVIFTDADPGWVRAQLPVEFDCHTVLHVEIVDVAKDH